MGAINNAFNQAAGAAAGAALAIKHAKETEESKMHTAEHSALIARDQARSAETEYNTATAENGFITDEKGKTHSLLASSMVAEHKFNEAKSALAKAQNRKNASNKTVAKKLNDVLAARSAADALNAKIEAINAMAERAKEQRAAADKATQLAEKAKQKYQSRWGGK